MVRFAGVTGHAEPGVLMQCLKRYSFDTILMALNAADKYQKSFAEKLLPMAVEKQMGIIGMKIPARGRILASWQPLAKSEGKDRDGAGRVVDERSDGLHTIVPRQHCDRGLR